jgi:hypothetical protein
MQRCVSHAHRVPRQGQALLRLACGPSSIASEGRRWCECRSSAAVAFPTDPSFQPEKPSQSGRKQWSTDETQKAKRRGKVFLTFSMALAIPLFCIMLAIFPIVWLFDRARRRAEHWINKIWARWSTGPFNKVTVRMPGQVIEDVVYCVPLLGSTSSCVVVV